MLPRRKGTSQPFNSRFTSYAGAVLGVIFGAFWVVGITHEHWGVRNADAAHPYGVLFKGGRTWYFARALGWLLDFAPLIIAAGICALFVVDWRSRRRTGSRPRVSPTSD